MSDRRFGSILVIVVTLMYCVFFYFNCIIVPYTAGYGKGFIWKRNNPIGGHDTVCRDEGSAGIGDNTKDDIHDEPSVIEIKPVIIGQAFQPLSELSQPASDQTGQTESTSETLNALAQPVPPRSDETNKTVQPRLSDKPQTVQSQPSDTNQGGSRVLLSGSRAVKALSALSLKDKLWLIKVLSRCSMEEFLRIRAMLEDGVTYQENLEMYMILRQKVTDEEQKRLDNLIEAYTR
ncbi:MAG: hypothetical protein WCS98_07005 [Bacillota bacterium]|nr:hypothetical protein [Bacillota bacterium]MDD3297974.1 hypothetical protein [Bacillota bacterium]MDD3850750.1 hypothetical protein [Bacillota bacterium]MDD4707752.1 hypothetical protein [Bacillota bacterium]